MNNDFSDSNPSMVENERNLAERVAQLERRLDETLLMLTDVQRYGRLGELLATNQWRAADEETTKAMLEVAGETSQDTLSPGILQSFPCNAIRVIDQLWRKYSHDRFGFSVQLQLYQSVGGSMDSLRAQDLEMLRQFGDRIGAYQNKTWLDYEAHDFTSSAPIGSLPAHWWHSPYGAKMANFFFIRLMNCEL